MKIAGLDIGTTGCKCTVFDESGEYLGKAYRDYPVRREVGGHEIDVSAIMDGVYACIREMAEQYPDISGIGVTSFGETFVCTDEAGNPLHPAMLYTDPRGIEECRELVDALGEKHIAEMTGLRPHEMYSISKIMWLRKNLPEVYREARHIFLMEDFVVFHLTGNAQIDYSLASRTMAFDIAELCWCSEVLEAAGVSETLFSKPVPTGSDAGCISLAASQNTGLSPETRVISVSHDQVSAAVGAGAFDGSVAVDGAGTVECVTPIYDGLPDTELLYNGYFAVVPYVIPGKYVAYAFSYTGGALIQWCIETLCRKEKELAKDAGVSVNEYLEERYAASHGDDPSGLLVLPHFAGAATPYMDTGSKGAILGLTAATTSADLYRACMEGVVYEMLLNVETMRGAGEHFEKLHATGGGARSATWMQMKADMLGLPIVALKTVDAGTVGSAMLTGVSVGLFRDLKDAAAHMVEEVGVYEPRRERYEAYREIFERYQQVYRAVRPLV